MRVSTTSDTVYPVRYELSHLSRVGKSTKKGIGVVEYPLKAVIFTNVQSALIAGRCNIAMTDKELIALIDHATKRYSGLMTTLEAAIGVLLVGRNMGWKPMLLIHDKKTLRKYERVLGVQFRDVLPEVGPWANKSMAWRAVQKVGNFWKAVKGEIPNIRSPDIL